jgi:hypothetical protein
MKCGALMGLVIMLAACGSVVSDMEPLTGEVDSITVGAPGAKADDLYIVSNSWCVDTFVSAESVIEFQDKEAGMIKGKYVTDLIDGMYYVDVKTIITVQVKDEKARMILSDPMMRITGDSLNGTYTSAKSYTPISSSSVHEKMKSEWQNLLSSFESAIKTQKGSW